MPFIVGQPTGPGGKPLYLYVLYGESNRVCAVSNLFIEKSPMAKITVGSACSGIPLLILLM